MNRDEQLVSIVEALYEAVLRPEEWTRLLELLRRTFDAGVVELSHFDVDHRDQTISRSLGLDPSDLQRYLEYFASRNDWVEAGHDQVPDRVVVGEELVPQAVFEQSEYYNDFLRPVDLAHVMGAGIRGDGRQFTALSLVRSKRRGTFDRDEVTVLEHVLPHLKRAAQIHERVASVGRGGHPLAAVADRLSDGLIILDARGRPLFANRAAHAILSGADMLQLTRESLRARSAAHDTRLRGLVQSATSRPGLGSPGGGGMMAVPRGGHSRPLVILVTPAGSGDSWLDGGGQAAAVWLRDPAAVPTPPSEWLRAAFGLTAAEASLAALLLGGHDVKEAADRHRISVHTARSQLKTVLQKTGTRGQTELVRLGLAAAIPPA